MITTPKIPNPATRANLEAEYLRRLFARDALIWSARMRAADSIVSNGIVVRSNNEKARPAALSIFEDSYRVLR